MIQYAVIIRAQKIIQKEEAGEDVLARFCFLYPSYTFNDARKLPYRRIQRMIKAARKEQAYQWYNLLRITTAPHGKKGSINDLIKEYRNIIDN